jgi:hypothetical protein
MGAMYSVSGPPVPAGTPYLLRRTPTSPVQVRDLASQHEVVRRRALRLGTPEPDTTRTTEITTAHDTTTRSPPSVCVQHRAPVGVSLDGPDTSRLGITECSPVTSGVHVAGGVDWSTPYSRLGRHRLWVAGGVVAGQGIFYPCVPGHLKGSQCGFDSHRGHVLSAACADPG